MAETANYSQTAKYEEARKIFIEHLHVKKQRKTQERLAILEEIYQRTDHFDADSLYIEMKNKKFQVSRSTVYNTLELLIECDLVVKHQFGSGQARFEKAHGFRQHDHLICIDCGKVLEFCDPRVADIQNMIGDILNFSVKSHSLILYGNCTKTPCENKK